MLAVLCERLIARSHGTEVAGMRVLPARAVSAAASSYPQSSLPPCRLARRVPRQEVPTWPEPRNARIPRVSAWSNRTAPSASTAANTASRQDRRSSSGATAITPRAGKSAGPLTIRGFAAVRLAMADDAARRCRGRSGIERRKPAHAARLLVVRFASHFRVVSSVNSSVSRGMLVTKGPTSQPRPYGIPRVSVIDSHWTYTPSGRSTKRQ